MLRKFCSFSYRSFYQAKLPNQACMFHSVKQDNLELSQLLDLANDFMKTGKVRTAEDIYKKLIDKHPYSPEPYQKLWDSWHAHRSFKVTEKEMDDFIEKYEKYIKPSSKGVAGP